MSKVSLEVSKKELQLFIDSSGINIDVEVSNITTFKKEDSDNKIDDIGVIKKILKLQTKGLITIDEKGEVTVKLQYPLTKGVDLKELNFRNRITAKEQKDRLSQFKIDDADGRLIAVTAARTNQGTGIISSLDQMDLDNAALITSLFL